MQSTIAVTTKDPAANRVPIELWLMILEACPFSSSELAEIALISPTLRAVAQQLLFKFMHITIGEEHLLLGARYGPGRIMDRIQGVFNGPLALAVNQLHISVDVSSPMENLSITEDVPQYVFDHILKLQNLRGMVLGRFHLQNRHLVQLQQLPHLTHLRLVDMESGSDAYSLPPRFYLTSLEMVHIRTSKTIALVQVATMVNEITIEQLSLPGFQSADVISWMLACKSPFSLLRFLQIPQDVAEDSRISEVFELLPNLETLILTDGAGDDDILADRDIRAIHPLPPHVLPRLSSLTATLRVALVYLPSRPLVRTFNLVTEFIAGDDKDRFPLLVKVVPWLTSIELGMDDIYNDDMRLYDLLDDNIAWDDLFAFRNLERCILHGFLINVKWSEVMRLAYILHGIDLPSTLRVFHLSPTGQIVDDRKEAERRKYPTLSLSILAATILKQCPKIEEIKVCDLTWEV